MLCGVKRPARAVMAFHNIKALNSLCGEWINHEVPLSISNIEPDIFFTCEIVFPDRKGKLHKTEAALKSAFKYSNPVSLKMDKDAYKKEAYKRTLCCFYFKLLFLNVSRDSGIITVPIVHLPSGYLQDNAAYFVFVHNATL